MANKMTSRQRMLAALHHDTPDRIPVAPWGLGRVGWNTPLGVELVARTDPWLETGLGCNPVAGAVWPVDTEKRGSQVRRVLHAAGRDLVAVTTTTAQTTASTEYFCKSLADIERGFRVLKSELEIGPVHLRLPERIRAHAAICFMALILYRVMRMRLRASESSLSPERALEVLRRVQRHQIRLDDATDPVTGISTMTLEQTDLFKALKIKKPLSTNA